MKTGQLRPVVLSSVNKWLYGVLVIFSMKISEAAVYPVPCLTPRQIVKTPATGYKYSWKAAAAQVTV